MNVILDRLVQDVHSEDWVGALTRAATVYVVGGCVRDALRDEEPKDIDIVVEGMTPSAIVSFLRPYGRVDEVGKSFAAIKFRPKGHSGEDYDIVVPRIDKKTGEGHKGFEVVTKGVTIAEDLRRRDFTINSIAVNVETGEVIDPFGGVRDVRKGLIRATDTTAFVEDPLRILRGIQFAARFGYQIEPGTLRLMQRNAELVKEISGERILDELQKIIKKEGDTALAIQLLRATGVDRALFGKQITTSIPSDQPLDEVSFYYVLGLLGDVDPSEYYMKRLKGNARTASAIKSLNLLMGLWDRQMTHREQLWTLFLVLNKDPIVADAVILPHEIEAVVNQMKTGQLPMSSKDVKLTGNDIIEITAGRLKDRELGDFLKEMIKDALEGKFNWKSREAARTYAAEIFYT